MISEFPEAAQNFSGETIDELLKLSEAGIIRVVVPGRQHHIVDLHHPDLTRLRSVESVREPFDDHWYTIQTLRRPPRAWVGGTHISGVSNPHQTARIGTNALDHPLGNVRSLSALRPSTIDRDRVCWGRAYLRLVHGV